MPMNHDEVSALSEELENKVKNSPNDDIIYLEVNTVKKIINYLEEIEEEKEDVELTARFGNRVDLPDDQWITKPSNQSLKEWYEERKREHLNEK
ncbi:hypothetical protein [Bacillus bombysepticus]|uniref:hypothetical protein n=1 Tax=Bacillus bombysepticus TaxID=658666 RepID=UPI00301AB20F